MSSGKPPWWRAFDRVERAIGKPLEEAADSNAYVNVMVMGMRVQRVVAGSAARAVGGAVGSVLRVANIPTRSDIRGLSRQMTTLTGEVRALAAAQEQASAPARSPTALRTSRARRRPADDQPPEADHSP